MNMPRPNRTVPYIILALVFLALSVVWFIYGRDRQTESAGLNVPVVVTSAMQGDLVRTLELTGIVESENQVTVLPKISGTLDSLLVTVGESVDKGQVIARIDPEMYLINLNQVTAAYQAAESTYERVKRLYDSGAGSEEQFSNAQAQYESLKSQYELARLQFEYTNVTSPVDGTVLAKHMNPGSAAAPQIPIVTIGSLETLVVSVQVPEEYYRYFSEPSGWPASSARQPAAQADSRISAGIISVAPFISPESRSFEVSVGISTPDLVRPGMLLYISFAIDSRPGAWYLPARALRNGESLWYVNDDGSASSLELAPSYYDGNVFPIPDQWRSYRFIIEGQHFIEDGQQVSIIGESVQ
jgi:membrane fusion protein (multidrug efflux system)